jgi:hypothetical protein
MDSITVRTAEKMKRGENCLYYFFFYQNTLFDEFALHFLTKGEEKLQRYEIKDSGEK